MLYDNCGQYAMMLQLILFFVVKNVNEFKAHGFFGLLIVQSSSSVLFLFALFLSYKIKCPSRVGQHDLV